MDVASHGSGEGSLLKGLHGAQLGLVLLDVLALGVQALTVLILGVEGCLGAVGTIAEKHELQAVEAHGGVKLAVVAVDEVCGVLARDTGDDVLAGQGLGELCLVERP